MSVFLSHYNYWVVIFLMLAGLYVVIAQGNLVKKLVGLNLFQTAVFILYISVGKVAGGTAPILTDAATRYSNPLPHVLILTAIVVGIATTALGLALVIRINSAYGTVEERELQRADLAHQTQTHPSANAATQGSSECRHACEQQDSAC